jgi:hypothetical protein
VYVAHDGRLREIRAECALRKEQLGEARKACETALGSFALVVDDAELSRIKAPDAGPIVPDAAPAAAPPSAPAAAPAGVPPAPPAPRIAPARPWWAGPGIVLVVVLLPVLAFFGYRLLKDLRK